MVTNIGDPDATLTDSVDHAYVPTRYAGCYEMTARSVETLSAIEFVSVRTSVSGDK